ncbi:unnamed protein product [Oppiella nova]|uniref:BTB domain-containing protein n=1 Tax=Oppiella nova TaxID=334625 RepID=A0A7R9MF38_9ACAR|nr:unnamed protein product [Oppiella nova]CAG2175902.1 unnamed protein product [Oppiella nova]
MHTPIATKTNDKIIAEDSDSEIYYSYDDESDEEYTTPLAAKSVVTWALNPLAKEWRQKSCSEFDRQLVNGNQFLEPLVTDNGYTVTSIDSITSVSSYDPIMSRFKEFLWEAFNNPMDSDIVFILQNKPIYCNKAILKLRNKKFWQKCEQSLGTESEVKISVYSYETFIALLMYFYGLTPDVNDRNCTELIKLGNIYDEQELIDLCTQHISTIKS